MKSWRIEIWVTGVDAEGFGTSRRVEFERDTRDGAHGFGMSEIQRLIDEVEAEERATQAPE